MTSYHNKQPIIKDNTTINSGNFSQVKPNTPIFVGVTGLIINGGNFTNCSFPPDTILNCKLPLQIDFCKHLHPDMDIPDEGEINEPCRHSTDEIEDDGVIIGYIRGDIVNG